VRSRCRPRVPNPSVTAPSEWRLRDRRHAPEGLALPRCRAETTPTRARPRAAQRVRQPARVHVPCLEWHANQSYDHFRPACCLKPIRLGSKGRFNAPSSLPCARFRVFELHGDEVGGARSVAGADPLKRFVQGSRRLPIPDRREQMLSGPATATWSGTMRMPLRVRCAPAVPPRPRPPPAAGQSRARFVEAIRLEAARMLLSRGLASNDVAAKVGLSPTSRLTQAFGDVSA
jgi:hypothetical protein